MFDLNLPGFLGKKWPRNLPGVCLYFSCSNFSETLLLNLWGRCIVVKL